RPTRSVVRGDAREFDALVRAERGEVEVAPGTAMAEDHVGAAGAGVRRADDEVVVAVAVDVARHAHAAARVVLEPDTDDGDGVVGEHAGGGVAVAEDDVGAPGAAVHDRVAKGRGDQHVREAVAVEIPAAGHGHAGPFTINAVAYEE